MSEEDCCLTWITSQCYNTGWSNSFDKYCLTALLENNGMQSCGKGSRHIRIKYFFVTDKIKDKELTIIYCPTKQMVADFFTKALQGELYFTHRNSVLGINAGDMSIYINDYKMHQESMKRIVKP